MDFIYPDFSETEHTQYSPTVTFYPSQYLIVWTGEQVDG